MVRRKRGGSRSDHRNRTRRAGDMVDHGLVVVSVEDQLRAALGNCLAKTAGADQAAVPGRRSGDRRVVDQHDAEQSLIGEFGKLRFKTIRLRLVAVKHGGAEFALKGADGKYLPEVLLDLDYWALMPL